MSASSAEPPPARTAETRQRSAPSPSRTSTNCRNHALSDDERYVPPQAVTEAPPLVRDRVAPRREIDEPLAAPDLRRVGAEVVGPLVERPAAPEVEPRVVPVAGEDAVLHRAAVERE